MEAEKFTSRFKVKINFAGPCLKIISTRRELANLMAKRRYIILFTPCTFFYVILKFCGIAGF